MARWFVVVVMVVLVVLVSVKPPASAFVEDDGVGASIVGGTLVTDTNLSWIQEHTCTVYNNAGSKGTGFLVEPDLIVTAAHVVAKCGPQNPTVKFADSNTIYSVRNVLSGGGNVNARDWAVLRLHTKLSRTPAKVWMGPMTDGETGLVAGFGRGHDDKLAAALVKIKREGAMIRATWVNGVSCQGDSGGPVYIMRNGQWQAVGIVSGADYWCASSAVFAPVQIALRKAKAMPSQVCPKGFQVTTNPTMKQSAECQRVSNGKVWWSGRVDRTSKEARCGLQKAWSCPSTDNTLRYRDTYGQPPGSQCVTTLLVNQWRRPRYTRRILSKVV